MSLPTDQQSQFINHTDPTQNHEQNRDQTLQVPEGPDQAPQWNQNLEPSQHTQGGRRRGVGPQASSSTGYGVSLLARHPASGPTVGLFFWNSRVFTPF